MRIFDQLHPTRPPYQKTVDQPRPEVRQYLHHAFGAQRMFTVCQSSEKPWIISALKSMSAENLAEKRAPGACLHNADCPRYFPRFQSLYSNIYAITNAQCFISITSSWCNGTHGYMHDRSMIWSEERTAISETPGARANSVQAGQRHTLPYA